MAKGQKPLKGTGRPAAAMAGGEAASRSKRGSGVAPSDDWIKKQVQKVINRTFKDFTATELDEVVINGLSCRQVLERDKKLWVMEGVPALSVAYYRAVRARFRVEENLVARLTFDKTAEGNKAPCNEQLVEAWAACHGAHPRRALLAAWCRGAAKISEKEFAGTLRHVSLIQNVGGMSDEGLDMCVDCSSMIVRLGLREEHPALCTAIRPYLDQCICTAMRRYACSDTTIPELLERFAACLPFVLCLPDAQKVAAVADAELDVHIELLAGLTSSSSSAEFLFHPKLAVASTSRMQKSLVEVLSKLTAKPCSQRAYDELKQQWLGDTLSFYDDPKRKVVRDVWMHGYAVPVKCSSLSDYFDKRAKGHLLTLLCAWGKVPWAGVEQVLAEEPPKVKEVPVTLPDVQGWVRAWELANVACKLCKTARSIHKALSQPKLAAKLHMRDRHFDLEIAYWSGFVGGDVEALCERKVLACLPDQDTRMSIAASMEKLSTLKGSAFYEFVSAVGQSRVQSCQRLLGRLRAGHGCTQANAGPFLTKVIARCSYFIVHPGTDDKQLYGREAVLAKFTNLEKIKTKLNEKEQEQLELVNVFREWLDASTVERLTAFTKRAAEQGGKAASSSSANAAPDGGDTPYEKRGAKRKTAVEEALDLLAA